MSTPGVDAEASPDDIPTRIIGARPPEARAFSMLSAPVRRLARIWPEAAEALATFGPSLPFETVLPNAEIVGEGRNLPARLILSGWAARVRCLEDGRRQVLALLLPGDTIGLTQTPRSIAVCPIVAVTRVELGDGTSLRDSLADPEKSPALVEALARAAALDEAYLLAQITRLGRQSAYERLGHLFLELRERLDTIGQVDNGTYPMPLTQDWLADLSGLSLVHVNRTLQQMRRDGLLELGAGRLALLKPRCLAHLADYQPPEPHGRLPAAPRHSPQDVRPQMLV